MGNRLELFIGLAAMVLGANRVQSQGQLRQASPPASPYFPQHLRVDDV